jgi:hypothetical protein
MGIAIRKKKRMDLGTVSPIKAYIDNSSKQNARILIPGCGNSYEAEYLIKRIYQYYGN